MVDLLGPLQQHVVSTSRNRARLPFDMK